LRALAGFLEALYQVPAPDVDASLSPRELLPLLGIGRKFRTLGKHDMTELLRAVPMPVKDLLDDALDHETLKAAIGAGAVRDIRQGPRSGGTAFVLLHYLTGAGDGSVRARPWWQGGPDALANSLAELARQHGVDLIDLRRPPSGLNVPTGENLTIPARIALTVGSDCAIGKKTVALELDLEARRRGLRSVFVPTGQTGIAIAGWGIAVDAVVSDFLAGAAERLVVEGHRRGGELLFVEGQGSLVHPAYSGVTLGLLHGAAPHVLVLCHRAGAALHERISLPLRPAHVACLALNTAHLEEEAAVAAIAAAADETGLPADDPVRFGAGPLLDAVVTAIDSQVPLQAADH
jgi:hypothetical protein